MIDSAPIRQKARANYEKARREVEKLKSEAEQFQVVDHPKFMQWLHSSFGPLISESRELHRKLMEVEDLVNEVQQEYFFGNHRSIVAAYQAVMRRRQETESDAEAFSHSDPPGPDGEAGGEDFDTDPGESFREFASALGFEMDGNLPGKGLEPIGRQNRIKDVYRALVRRLHPDKSRVLTKKEIEWWHQTQDAYENGDLERLEMILTLCDIEDKGTRETSVSTLALITAQFKKSLRSLKREISGYRRDPAWNFTSRRDHSDLHRRAEETFKSEREILVYKLKKFETMVQNWAEQAPRPRTRRVKQQIQEELF